MNHITDAVLSQKVKVIPAEVYSRISGYYRPVYTNGKSGQWNRAKTEEFTQRKYLNIENALNKTIGDYYARSSSEEGLQR